MVCAIHWFGYYFESELISFYEHYCLYENCPQLGDYHTMVDGFGACVNHDTNRFQFLLQSI